MSDDGGARVAHEFRRHQSVNHSIGEYVRGDAHTNTIEGYFSIVISVAALPLPPEEAQGQFQLVTPDPPKSDDELTEEEIDEIIASLDEKEKPDDPKTTGG